MFFFQHFKYCIKKDINTYCSSLCWQSFICQFLWWFQRLEISCHKHRFPIDVNHSCLDLPFLGEAWQNILLPFICMFHHIAILCCWKLKWRTETYQTCLFGFNVAFNNFSVISQLCLVVTVSSMLTFIVLRLLPHWSIMPQTLDMIPYPVTASWHCVDQS